jgi:hypothetical protein
MKSLFGFEFMELVEEAGVVVVHPTRSLPGNDLASVHQQAVRYHWVQ